MVPQGGNTGLVGKTVLHKYLKYFYDFNVFSFFSAYLFLLAILTL